MYVYYNFLTWEADIFYLVIKVKRNSMSVKVSTYPKLLYTSAILKEIYSFVKLQLLFANSFRYTAIELSWLFIFAKVSATIKYK